MKQLILACALYLGIAALSSQAAEPLKWSDLEGQWTGERVTRNDRQFTPVLKIQGKQVVLEFQNDTHQAEYLAKGRGQLEQAGPFNILKIVDIQAGRASEDLRPSEEPRATICQIHNDKLYLANNFDRVSSREKPSVMVMTRSEAPKAGTASANLPGMWKMEVALGDNTRNYDLRIAESDGKLKATLISSRSGEHPAKEISFDNGKFAMKIDREYNGTDVTLVFTGKLDAGILSGKMAVEGMEDRYTGTFKAIR